MLILYNILQFDDMTGGQIEDWLGQLPLAKQNAITRLTNIEDRLRSLAGLQLLKSAMHQLGEDTFQLSQLCFSPRGKPYLPTTLRHFSISHAGQLVACAISSAPIGLDVEPRLPGKTSGLSHYFSPAEQAMIAQQPSRLGELWTRKEAVVKAAGEAGLAAIASVELAPQHARLGAAQWWTHPLALHADYHAHLATPLAEPNWQIKRITHA